MRIPPTARIPLLAAAAVALSLGLTGCVNPVETIIDRTLEENGVDVDRDGGETTWETEDGDVSVKSGDDVTLPATFPSDVPVPNGRLTSVVESEGNLATQWEEVTRDEVTRLANELTGAGYVSTSLTDTDTAYMGSFEGETRTVSIIWSDGDASGGALIYGVTDNP